MSHAWVSAKTRELTIRVTPMNHAWVSEWFDKARYLHEPRMGQRKKKELAIRVTPMNHAWVSE